jgi:hypothetical protein
VTSQWTVQYGVGARHGGTLGGGGTGLCRGSALSDSARRRSIRGATRPGPYTVRVRHFGPQEMNINMFVDGKGCGESQVRLGLGVFALRADKRRTGEQITSSSKWATFSGFRGGSTLVKGMELRCVSHPLG